MKLNRTFGFFTLAIAVVIASCGKKNTLTPAAQEKVIKSYDFSAQSPDWVNVDNQQTTRTTSGGYYHVLDKSDSVNYFVYGNAMFNGLTDKIGLELKANIKGGNTAYPAFGGMTWNFNAGNNAYNVFGFYNDGRFEIFGYDDQNNFIEIKEPTSSTAIVKNGDNVLRIEQRSDQLHFLINGTEVFVTDKGNDNLDISGFYADPKTTTSVDYFKAVQLP